MTTRRTSPPDMSDREYYEQWQRQPAKYCSTCGAKQTFEQFNFDKGCHHGCSTPFVVMTPEAAKELWNKQFKDSNLPEGH